MADLLTNTQHSKEQSANTASRQKSVRKRIVRQLLVLVVIILLIVVTITHFTVSNLNSGCPVWLKNETGAKLCNVTLSYGTTVVKIGEIEDGDVAQLSVPYSDLQRLRYQCKRADGSSVDTVVGISNEGNLSRFEIFTRPGDIATNYEWRSTMYLEYRIDRFVRYRRW